MFGYISIKESESIPFIGLNVNICPPLCLCLSRSISLYIERGGGHRMYQTGRATEIETEIEIEIWTEKGRK